MPDDNDVRAGEALYEVRPSGEVRLRGVRCRACGMPAFPAQTYGCEYCGGDLRSLRLATDGTVAAFTVVPAEDGPDGVLCEVVLAAGPRLLAWWAGSKLPSMGAAVVGTTAVVDSRERCVFVPVSAEGGR
jgi:uncharacterized OB-fold protein